MTTQIVRNKIFFIRWTSSWVVLKSVRRELLHFLLFFLYSSVAKSKLLTEWQYLQKAEDGIFTWRESYNLSDKFLKIGQLNYL